MEDIPKSVILVLLVITVLVSVLGTWTVMDQLSGSKIQVDVQPAPSIVAGGKVSFTPIDPNAVEEGYDPLPVKGTGGYVSLGFEEPKEGN